ncbi:UDP-N-acetylglucosamine 1-carboxyvinyltransferase [Candidatus Acetothermia bacterium]|nr:UDP-N-acetylglucosamine 1-carboxyvinyltransferase [Candidatus Acetothermia bacterium]MBI3643905.1 UDP-N-acetylglucosamine 1-carboxyvinyltransferase [Candidatus Acetothermia bacterium]
MSDFRITGGHRLEGKVRAQGSKNASLPIFVATLLTDEEIILRRVPHLKDIHTLTEILQALGKTVEHNQSNIYSFSKTQKLSGKAPHQQVRKMRASFLVLGPLLARIGGAEVALPGGDAIGMRPVDLHLSGLQAMGAEFELREGVVYARAKRLRPAEIFLKYPSVGATEHLMMTAALIPGRTAIHNPAQEPEISDLAQLLTKMGAKITVTPSHIEVAGCERLCAADHTIIPDRLCAGTYAIATALCGGEVEIGANPTHLRPLIAVLREAGVKIEEHTESILVRADKNQRYRPLEIETRPHPGFPTDLQAPMMPLLALASGTSRITETVFEDRFAYVQGLQKMGASVEVWGQTAIIHGVEKLHGAEVQALDIRAGVALVLAGLAAEGVTIVRDPKEHIARGYQNLGGDLRQIGAEISAT